VTDFDLFDLQAFLSKLLGVFAEKLGMAWGD